ncbi:MAG: hypothetical protein C5B54_04510 [Acidobacteria bacterium]|nr:MAG: hypothetical protein C5B54_04510 [Acidobacteriota bacterium]
MKRNRSISIYSLAISFLAIFTLTFTVSCKKKQEEEDEKETAVASVQVQTARVQRGLIRKMITVSGTLNALPDRDVKVSALVPGRIETLLVIEGNSVEKNQLIAKLNDATLQDQLRQAKATLENAQSNEQRLARLYERGIAAHKEEEDAHRDLVTAQAAYDTARTQLGRTEVRSPIQGIIVKRFLSIGEQVDGTGADPIVQVANFDPIELVGNLPTSYLSFVHEGEEVEVKTDAFKGTTFKGLVTSILPAIDPASGSATVRIRVPNQDHRLKGGMFATASIVAESHSDALYVPVAAFVNTNDQPKVFVVGTDSKVQERSIKPGERDTDKLEILEGVKEGETVVTTGSYGLADGMKVIPESANTRSGTQSQTQESTKNQ